MSTRSVFTTVQLTLGLMLLGAPAASAAVFTSLGTGNWNSGTCGVPVTWTKVSGTDGDCLPDSDDTITINSGHVVTVSAAGAGSSITDLSGTLTINSGITLTLGGGAANLISISSGGILNVNGTLTLSNNGGHLLMNAGSTINDGASCAINLAGSWTNSGGAFVFDACTVTLNRSGGGTQQIYSDGGTFYHLVLNNTGGTDANDNIYVGDALNVDGNLTVTDGEFILLGTVNVAGNFTIQAAGSFTPSGYSVTLDGSGDQSLTSNGQSFYDLTITNAGNVSPQDALVVTDILTVSGGTLALGTQNATVGTGNSNGGIVGAGAITHTSGTVTLLGSANLGGTGSTPGTCSGTNGSFGFYTLTLGDGTNAKTTTLCGNVTVADIATIRGTGGGDAANHTLTASTGTLNITRAQSASLLSNGSLTINATDGVDCSADGCGIDINGALTFASSGTPSLRCAGRFDLIGAGTVTAGLGEVVLDRASGIQTFAPNGKTLYKLKQDGAGTVQPVATNGNMVVSNTFSMTASAGIWDMNTNDPTFDLNGTFSQAGGTFQASATASFTVAGSWTKSGGTFTHNNAIVTFDAGATGNTITSGGMSFYDLVFSNGLGGWILQDAMTVSNDLTMTNGGLSLNGKDLAVAGGDIAGSGTIYCGSENNTCSAGTTTLTGSGNLDPGTYTFYNLTLGDGAASAATVILTLSNLQMMGDLIVSTNHALSLNEQTITISGGDVTGGGTIYCGNGNNTCASGNVLIAGSGNLDGGTFTFYDLSLGNSNGTTTLQAGTYTFKNQIGVASGGAFALNSLDITTLILSVSGTVYCGNGDNTCSAGTVTILGGTGGIGGGSTTVYNLTVGDATTSTTANAYGAFTVKNNFVITSSSGTNTFDGNSYTVTLAGTGGTPFAINGETFTADLGTIAYTGNYASGNTTVTATTYNDLTLNNSSETYAAGGTVAVGDDVTVTAGIFTMGTQSMSVGGDISVASGASFTATWIGGGTLTFTGGTASVNVGGAGGMTSTTTTIAAGKTVTLAGNWTVQGALTRTGNLDLASYTLTHYNDGAAMSGAGTFTAGTNSSYVPCLWNAQTITLQALTYYNLKPSNCFTAGTDRIFSIQTGTVMNGSLSVNGARANLAGTITIADALNVGTNSATSQVDLGSASVSVGGNVAVYSGATLTPGTSTVTLNGTADQSITSTTEAFNNLIINNTGTAGNDDITLGDALTVNSTLTVTDGAFAIGGTSVTAAAVTINGGALSLATSGGQLKISGGGTLAMSSGSLTTADVATPVEITSSAGTLFDVNLTGGTLTVPELAVDYLTGSGFVIGAGVTLTQFDGVRWGDSSNVYHGDTGGFATLLAIYAHTSSLRNHVFPTTWAVDPDRCNVDAETSGVVTMWDWTGAYGGEENDCDLNGGEVVWKGGIGGPANSASGAFPAIY